MSEHEPPGEPPKSNDSARGTDAPRALSFERYQFNFNVDVGAQIAARFGGAPAFSVRRARLKRDTDSFWGALEAKYQELWMAALDGRISEDGREIRQNLLDAEGSDHIGAREHRRRLFSANVDVTEHARLEFNRAWERQLDHCGLPAMAAVIEEYVKYFPIETDMPVDPETDQFMWMGEPWVPPEVPTRESVLERFPFR